MTPVQTLATTEAAILQRVLQPDRADLPPALAHAVLQGDFPEEDRQRMALLLNKGQVAELTPTVQEALANYRRVGYFLDLLRSKARLTLQRAKRADIAGVDPMTQRIVPLFHPRKDRWKRHFQWEGPVLRGKTARASHD